MKNLKYFLLICAFIGPVMFALNDWLYYDLPMNPNNKPFLEHIIIGWLIIITNVLTLTLLYKEKK